MTIRSRLCCANFDQIVRHNPYSCLLRQVGIMFHEHVFKVIVEKLDRDHLPHDISKQEGDNDLASRDLLTPIAQRLHGILGFEGNMLSLEEVVEHLGC
jgi:hypothetical protein